MLKNIFKTKKLFINKKYYPLNINYKKFFLPTQKRYYNITNSTKPFDNDINEITDEKIINEATNETIINEVTNETIINEVTNEKINDFFGYQADLFRSGPNENSPFEYQMNVYFCLDDGRIKKTIKFNVISDVSFHLVLGLSIRQVLLDNIEFLMFLISIHKIINVNMICPDQTIHLTIQEKISQH